jgi:hypothetical protein
VVLSGCVRKCRPRLEASGAVICSRFDLRDQFSAFERLGQSTRQVKQNSKSKCGMAAQPHKSCRPRSTSPLAGVTQFPTAFLHPASEPRPAGRRAAHLRSEAGQGHGRFLPVTLPRERSDQRKRAEAGTYGSPTPGGTHQGRGWGTHQGRDQGTPGGTQPGGRSGVQEIAERRSGRRLRIILGNSTEGTVRGPKSASARPGPCTRPRSADALTQREYHPARQTPASRSFLLAADADGGGWPGGRPAAAGAPP